MDQMWTYIRKLFAANRSRDSDPPQDISEATLAARKSDPSMDYSETTSVFSDMYQLFTRDRDDFRTTLGIVCRHLTWIGDLLSLEEVSDLCRSAVQAHHHNRQVEISFPYYSFTRLAPPSRGPILTNLVLEVASMLLRDRKSDVNLTLRQTVIWMVTVLNERAAHLKKLKIEMPARRRENQPDQVLIKPGDVGPDYRLVLFTKVTTLKISFASVIARQPPERRLISTLLRYFPALQVLELAGNFLPLLSELPNPETLKVLKIYVSNAEDLRSYWDASQAPNVLNFQRLELIGLYCTTTVEIPEIEDTSNAFTATTGVSFLRSLSASRVLREIVPETLSYWSVALLSSDQIGSSDGVRLQIELLGFDDCFQRIQDLEARLRAGSLLKRVTHLKIGYLRTGRGISEFLKLTPTLRELTIKSADDGLGQEKVGCPLHSLVRLTVPEGMRRAWVESVQRNAPSTLEVIRKSNNERYTSSLSSDSSLSSL